MAFTFINNFSTVTVNPLTPGDTTLELQSGFSDVKAAVDSGDTLVLTLFETNESGEETGREIVHVTAADGQAETLTIERGKEGTAGGDWGPNTDVEQRLTAGALRDLAGKHLANTALEDDSIIVGSAGGSSDYVYETVAIGDGVVFDSFTASAVAIGALSEAVGVNAVAVGYKAKAKSGVAIGKGSQSGVDTAANLPVAIGDQSKANKSMAIALGFKAEAAQYYAIAIGREQKASVESGIAMRGYHYLPEGNDSAPQAVLSSPSIDLTSTGSESIELPTGITFFPDSVEIICVEADGASGAPPKIQVGKDSSSPGGYLAPTEFGKTEAGGRVVESPLSRDGIREFRFEVTSAGTATALKAKVVMRGYFVEM